MDTVWHRWFAWHPVLVKSGRYPFAWLESVWRRRINGRWEHDADPETEEEILDRQW